VVAAVVRVLDAERDVRRAMERLTAAPFAPAVDDVRRQLHRLVGAGFIARTGAGRLADVERYLHAAAQRLERLPDSVGRDADRMRSIHELESLHAAAGYRPVEVRWLLEELRVAQFAQGLGVKGPVSAKRIRRALAEA
jgi:ATP-dependent helicase HrpA